MKAILSIACLALLAGCGRGNSEVYALLAESVVRTYLSSEVTLLDKDDTCNRRDEMRSVIAAIGRIKALADDYDEQLEDWAEQHDWSCP